MRTLGNFRGSQIGRTWSAPPPLHYGDLERGRATQTQKRTAALTQIRETNQHTMGERGMLTCKLGREGEKGRGWISRGTMIQIHVWMRHRQQGQKSANTISLCDWWELVVVRTLWICFNKYNLIFLKKKTSELSSLSLSGFFITVPSFPPLQVQPCVRRITADLGSVLGWSSRSQPAKSQRPYSAGQLVCVLLCVCCVVLCASVGNEWLEWFVCGLWSTYKRCGFLRVSMCLQAHACTTYKN